MQMEEDDDIDKFDYQVPDQRRRDAAALKLLRKGAKAWNAAYDGQRFPFNDEEYFPNLDGITLSGADLEGINFYGSLNRAHLSDCNLTGGNFDHTHFQGAKLKSVVAFDARFASARFENAELTSCSFDGSNLEDVFMVNAQIKECSFQHCHLLESSFADSVLEDVNLQYSYCRLSYFDDARMFGVKLFEADLSECSFERSSLPGRPIYMSETSFLAYDELDDSNLDSDKPDSSGADLSGSTFFDAGMTNLELGKSDLTNTTFYWCNLTGTDFRDCRGASGGAFRGCDLAGAKFANIGIFDQNITRIDRIVTLARPAYLANLLTCGALVAVFIFGDVSQKISIPIFSVSVARHNFALFGLLQSMCIGFYVSLYLQRVWEAAAELPTVLPNGTRAPEAISPWAALSPAWLHLRVIAEHRRFAPPAGFYAQYAVALLTHWLITPVTATAIALNLWTTDPAIRLPALFVAGVSLFSSASFYVSGARTLSGALVRTRLESSNYENWQRQTRLLRWRGILSAFFRRRLAPLHLLYKAKMGEPE